MKLTMKYIILYVSDLNQSLIFYRDLLGLPVIMQQGTYIEFKTGETILSINTREDVKEITGLSVPVKNVSSQTFELGFVVEDVALTIDFLRQRGVTILKKPVVKPWGQTVAYVEDPDGHFIEICTTV
ncbi:VOC family protein [Alkalibacterium sp. MB6]|uniref:VOC family protein n=1 Tax=Alkalibacterium sp. MB6 TaxID=2081965 RepID=UPI00137965D7|nr:VOC family protein [Alkalibacterium sp. MB6]